MTSCVHVISVGAFGGAVARHLRSLRGDTVETKGDDLARPAERASDFRIHIVAAWRPVPDLCDRLDVVSREQARPFVPLIADGAVLTLGPVIVAGGGCCWRCWGRRRRQHSDTVDRELAVHQHYATHPEAGPLGYLEPLARLGAARVSAVVDALDAGTAVAREVWQVDMVTRHMTTSAAAGVHDCSRCGLGRPVATRSYADMQRGLALLWERVPCERR